MDVYVLQRPSDGAFKVGVSSWVESRKKTIDRGVMETTELVYAWRCEREADGFELEHTIHRALDESALGGEWFACPLEAVLVAAECAEPSLFLKFTPVVQSH